MAFGFDDILMGVGGQLIGGLLGNDAAQSAADTQAAATDRAAQATLEGQKAAIAENARQFDLMRGDTAPYRSAGTNAVWKLWDMLGLGGPSVRDNAISLLNRDAINSRGYALTPEEINTPEFTDQIQAVIKSAGSNADNYKALYGQAENAPLLKKFTVEDFYKDPVVSLSKQFGLDQGQRGLENMARARGNINSGATLKALTQFGTDYGNQLASQSRGRFMEDQSNTYNKLAGIAGTGQTAMQSANATGAQMAGQNASIYANTGNTLGNLYSNLGNARGAAQIAGGNALGGAFNNIGNWYNQQQTLDKIINSRSMPDFSGYTTAP